MGMKPGKASTFFNQPRTLGYAARERFEELLGELLLALGEFHLAHRLISQDALTNGAAYFDQELCHLVEQRLGLRPDRHLPRLPELEEIRRRLFGVGELLDRVRVVVQQTHELTADYRVGGKVLDHADHMRAAILT
ncbi:hypothetical protein AGMMS50225_22910 [Betaproteobacteria bacterium]|nr:hypothetical protein AGMMS50225_22910 [Betaproteobacteria bacterium]